MNDDDDVLIFDDFVDDSILATSRRIQSRQFAKQGLAQTTWILRNRTQHRSGRDVTNLLRKLVEVAASLGRNLDLKHRSGLGLVDLTRYALSANEIDTR